MGRQNRAPIERAQIVNAHLNSGAWRSKWQSVLKGATTLWPHVEPPNVASFQSAIGKELDHRLRKLGAMDPLPLVLPEPLPWGPGFPLSDYWRLFWAPAMFADVDALTEMALEVLFPPFKSVPLKDRHTTLPQIGDIGLVGGYGVPDLIMGSALIDVKSYRRPAEDAHGCLDTSRQLAHMALQDNGDSFGIRHVAAYMARQGVVVDLPVTDLLGVADLEGLGRRREEYRVASGTLEWRRYVELCAGDTYLALDLFYRACRSGGAYAWELELMVAEPQKEGLEVATAIFKDKLRCHPLEDVLDALRGFRASWPPRWRFAPDEPMTLTPFLYWGEAEALDWVLGAGMAENIAAEREARPVRRRAEAIPRSPFRSGTSNEDDVIDGWEAWRGQPAERAVGPFSAAGFSPRGGQASASQQVPPISGGRGSAGRGRQDVDRHRVTRPARFRVLPQPAEQGVSVGFEFCRLGAIA